MIEIKPFSEAFEFIRNGVSIKQDSESSGLPITRIETIADEIIDSDRVGYANINGDSLGKYEKYLLEDGDILMSHINSLKHLGKTAIYNGHPELLIHGMNLLCLRPKIKLCSPNYLNYYFRSSYFKQRLLKISNKSVNQASFSVGNLKNLRIPLPPLKTQERIAEILDNAATLRDKTAQLLKEYDLLAQSIFLEMFGDPVMNPKGWKKSKTIDYCNCIVPGRDKPKSFTGGIPWVTTNDLNHLELISASKFKKGLTRGEVDHVRAKIIPVGSVIITCVGDLGVLSISKNEMVVNQQLHTFQCSEKINNIFLMYNLGFQKPYMYKMASNTTIPYMNKTIVNGIPTILPPISLQNQFTEKITLIEKQKELAKKELKESEDLFNCLLQKAFKGELVVEE